MEEAIVKGSVLGQVCPPKGLPSFPTSSKKFQTGVKFSPSGFPWKPPLLKSPSVTPSTRIDAVGTEHSQSVSFLVQEDGMTVRPGRMLRWWEKNLQPNMKEITSAQHLVDFLLSTQDKLVIVDFYSPGCGGCRALHPKICQIAEMNPDVIFLKVNYEEHKSMCYSLNVHVLPFFRFYRGAQGRVCSFSCTVATIKKFKDALAKHSTERCSLGPPKGLEESELLNLANNKSLSFTYRPPSRSASSEDLAFVTPRSNQLESSSSLLLQSI